MKEAIMRSDDHIKTLEDVLRLTGDAERNATRRRDMISAVKRLCEMAGTTPAGVLVEAPPLRGLLSRIRPAAHGISAKSYSNLRVSYCGAPADRHHQLNGARRSRPSPDLGAAVAGHCRRQAAVEWSRRFCKLVHNSGYLSSSSR